MRPLERATRLREILRAALLFFVGFRIEIEHDLVGALIARQTPLGEPEEGLWLDQN
jgi:hypothetical protein